MPGDVILIPWRGGDPDRERNLAAILPWYAPLGLPVVYGDSGHERFNRGASRNAAAANAGEWDVALILDADCIAELPVIREAMEIARATGRLVLPHNDFWDLKRQGTQMYLADPQEFVADPRKLHRLVGLRFNEPKAPSGALVVSRASFDRIGGYDPGFIGWGYEDSALLANAERIVGTERLKGKLIHLWHTQDHALLDPETVAHNRAILDRAWHG